jgi:ArsR family transcriptional regulator
MRELETYFKGLADATRLRIINLLSWGELCGCDIQRVLGASQPNVSRHLTYLKHAGLVVDRREGFRVFYRFAPANNETMKSLLEFLVVAFRRNETFRSDLRRLKHAIKEGACMVPPGGALRVPPKNPVPAAELNRRDKTGRFRVLESRTAS